jgi:outer membrane receptor protein involved in Fe transport
MHRRVGSLTTFDSSLSYAFGQESSPWLRGMRLALFAENVLDQGPPRLLADPGTSAGVGYDPVNASSRGRFVAVQLRRAW